MLEYIRQTLEVIPIMESETIESIYSYIDDEYGDIVVCVTTKHGKESYLLTVVYDPKGNIVDIYTYKGAKTKTTIIKPEVKEYE